MEKLDVMVPPPMVRDIGDFRDREGYENNSQAIRELLRRGLHEPRHNRADMEAALGTPAADNP